MHQGCASEHTRNPAHRPSPCVWPSHFLWVHPAPLTPHPAIWHWVTPPLPLILSALIPSFPHKNRMKGPFQLEVTLGNQSPGNSQKHTHTIMDILKFKGTASLISCCCVLHLNPQTTTTCSLSVSLQHLSLSSHSFFVLNSLHSCRQRVFLLDYWSMECVCTCWQVHSLSLKRRNILSFKTLCLNVLASV